VIVDLKKEALAVREARRLGVPVVALVDTNCDPDEADYVIPGNDDAIRSCSLIVHALAESVSNGKQKVSAQELQQQPEAEAPVEAAPADDVEDVQAGEDIQPETEGDAVQCPLARPGKGRRGDKALGRGAGAGTCQRGGGGQNGG
jgi:small subunit ribosomal protein S2